VRERDREAWRGAVAAVVVEERGRDEGRARLVERDDARWRIEAEHERLPREIERQIEIGTVEELVRAFLGAPREVRAMAIGDEARAEAEASAFVRVQEDLRRVRRAHDVHGDRAEGRSSDPLAPARRTKTF